MTLKSGIIFCVLIALVGLVAYSNTFSAPFQWDDKHYIAENPIVQDIGYFANPLRAKGLSLYGALKGRYVGYLTFALNYRLHGIDVEGYHVFNLAIHILNGIVVFYLLRLTLRTPALLNSRLAEQADYIALFTALLFVSHPLQTEAVTYVFQRLASLAALFYMGSLALYARWRLTPLQSGKGVLCLFRSGRGHPVLYLLSVLCAILAMKTKENAFTLPVVIALYEAVFFTSPRPLPHPHPLSLWERVAGGRVRGYRLLPLLPFALTMLIVPVSLLGIETPAGEIIGGIGPATRGSEELTRGEYLFTELRVIVTYIRLLFVPVGQNVDHDYPVYGSLWNPQVFLSLLFILSLFAAALFMLYASRSKPALRLPAFGLLWFFITLSVESSLIPIPMVINEYRAYLPSAGFFMAAVSGLYLTGGIRKAAAALLVIATVVFSAATFKRNGLWASETALWEDAVRKSPLKARPHNNLGLGYIEAGLGEKAEREFKTALLLRPDYAMAHYNLALDYKNSGRREEAIGHFEEGLRLMPDAEAHNNLGALYGAKGMGETAAGHYMAAIKLKPDFAEAHFNLGLYYIEEGLPEEAEREFLAVLELRPQDNDAMRFLEYARSLR